MGTNQMPKILVISVPKSGTHLLRQIIYGIPQMKQDQLWYTDNQIDKLRDLKPGQIASGHLTYDRFLEEKLKDWDIDVIFISRDLRDVVVSLQHYYSSLPNQSKMQFYFRNDLKSNNERLMSLIQGVDASRDKRLQKYEIERWPNIYEYTFDKYEWRESSHVCAVTFEELVRSEQTREKEVLRIVNHLWDKLSLLGIPKKEIAQKMIDHINPKQSQTFRKGEIGDWQKEFTEEHKQAFKRVAGDLLIQLGYEKDHHW